MIHWNIVFVGAGGTGLSNVVGILRDLGFHNLVGIESQPSQITENLQKKGIQIFLHWKYQMKAEDILIYSSATIESEEVQKAKRLKKTQHTPLLIWDYFEFLGEMSKYFKTIAFTGTNGKSSSSALAIFAARATIENFGLGIVGALVPDFGGQSYCIGKEHPLPTDPLYHDLRNIFTYIFTGKKLDYTLLKKYYFFLEACEYQRHFLTLDINDAVITSLELEHTDYFKDWKDYQSAFLELIEKIKGHLYVLPNLPSEPLLKHKKTVILQQHHFDFQYLWWEHQQQNASVVYGLLSTLAPAEKKAEIKQRLEAFHGIRRRMEELTTTAKGTKIFSDYGHVASSLELGQKALKERFPDKRIICIFQPHQMHRILQGREDFPKALAAYDEHYIYNIYAAREKFENFSDDFSKKLCRDALSKPPLPTNINELGELFAKHCGSSYLKSFDEVKKIIEKSGKDDIIVVYSAGDIDYALRNYLQRI